MPLLDRLRVRLPVVLLAVGLAVLPAAGCASANQQNPASGPAQSLSLADALDKLEAISQDECETQPPATVYSGCTRFLTELANTLNSVRSEAAGLPQSAAVTAAANTITSAINDFNQRGCAPPPGLPPSAGAATQAPCVTDFARIQAGLRQLIAVLSPVVSRSATPS